jgi:lipopolysaccharide transport system permease protein
MSNAPPDLLHATSLVPAADKGPRLDLSAGVDELVIEAGRTERHYWHDLWRYRELFSVLAWRDISVRYKQTVIGAAWALIRPFLTMVVFTVIFGKLAKMPSQGVPYPLFVYAGLLPWMFVATAVTGASQSLVNQQALLTKIYLPRLFVPAGSVGGGLVDLLVSLLVFAVLMAWYATPVGWAVLALPGLVVLSVICALGVGLALAALTVTYRDFRYVVPFMVQAWMYLSPVIYPVNLIPERWQPVLAINPMVGIIEGFRSALLGVPWNFQALTISALVSIGWLLFGLFYFRKTERRFADIA